MSNELDTNLQGAAFDLTTASARRHAIDAAFDYRGDVTLFLASGHELVGYLFHRDWTRGEGVIEMFPADGGPAVRLLVHEVERIAFTGRDTAAGKSWEAWQKRAQEAKIESSLTSRGPDATAA